MIPDQATNGLMLLALICSCYLVAKGVKELEDNRRSIAAAVYTILLGASFVVVCVGTLIAWQFR